MKKTLHILNGDSSYFIFKQSHLEGDHLIWREILSDGPVSKDNLWEVRAKWIEESFAEPEAAYREKVVEDVEKLRNWAEYDELVLWFEYDLVCQINLACILSLLSEYGADAQSVKLICPESIEGLPDFRGLGELTPGHFEQLFPARQPLNQEDLDLAAAAWNLYINNDAKAIEDFCKQDFGSLYLLKKALNLHLKRLEKDEQGLNFIEKKLITLSKTENAAPENIYARFSASEPWLGMGDAQVFLILKYLKQKNLIPTSVNV